MPLCSSVARRACGGDRDDGADSYGRAGDDGDRGDDDEAVTNSAWESVVPGGEAVAVFVLLQRRGHSRIAQGCG